MAAQKSQTTVGTSVQESAAQPRQPQGGQQKKRNWDWAKLEIVHRNAAGIDVGSREHWVAMGADRDPEPVRRFGCFTGELHRMADWLVERGIQTVVLQSTGVYWIPVYDILEERGLRVFLVNAYHTKSLPGRKSDVQECQWLLKLHTYGLLNDSFRPPDQIRILRAIWRHRDGLVKAAAECIQRMQKALTQMNLQLHTVISDLSGATGMRIVRQILAGERDPRKLAALRDPQVKAPEEVIIASLEGNWRGELLFLLQQEVDLYDIYQQKIADCDEKLQEQLEAMPAQVDEQAQPLGRRKPGKKAQGNAPKFDLRKHLYRISGVDWTRVDGVDVMTAQTVIAEVGVDMSRWPTEKHFASWLGLCADNRKSGRRILKRTTRKVINPAAAAFRQAASTLLQSKSYLGAQYRRFRTKLGAPKAITAMAHKLARLFYRLLKYGEAYVDKGQRYYEEKYRELQIRLLHKKARELGYTITLSPAT